MGDVIDLEAVRANRAPIRAVEYYSDPSVPFAERAKALADEIDELRARIRRNDPEIFRRPIL